MLDTIQTPHNLRYSLFQSPALCLQWHEAAAEVTTEMDPHLLAWRGWLYIPALVETGGCSAATLSRSFGGVSSVIKVAVTARNAM